MIVLERIFAVLVAFTLATQVLLPLVLKWPLFFLFRRKTMLDERLAKAREQRLEEEKQHELEDVAHGYPQCESTFDASALPGVSSTQHCMRQKGHALENNPKWPDHFGPACAWRDEDSIQRQEPIEITNDTEPTTSEEQNK